MSRSLSSFSGNDGDVASRILGRRQVSAYPEVQLEAGKTDAAAVVSSVRAVLDENPGSYIPSIEVPTLFVYGLQDPLISLPGDEWLRQLEEHMRVIPLEDSRHFPMLDEVNKFNRLLKQFLEFKEDLDSIELKEEWRRRTR